MTKNVLQKFLSMTTVSVIALSVSALSVSAADEEHDIFADDLCEAKAAFAQMIMELRQTDGIFVINSPSELQNVLRGLGVQGVIEDLDKGIGEQTELYITEAYKIPRYSTQESKEQAALDFANEVMVSCKE